MSKFVILLLTCALLATQFYWGLRRKKWFGAILPTCFLGILGTESLLERSFAPLAIAAPCVAALLVVWIIGYSRAAGYEQEKLNQMKAKDLP